MTIHRKTFFQDTIFFNSEKKVNDLDKDTDSVDVDFEDFCDYFNEDLDDVISNPERMKAIIHARVVNINDYCKKIEDLYSQNRKNYETIKKKSEEAYNSSKNMTKPTFWSSKKAVEETQKNAETIASVQNEIVKIIHEAFKLIEQTQIHVDFLYNLSTYNLYSLEKTQEILAELFEEDKNSHILTKKAKRILKDVYRKTKEKINNQNNLKLQQEKIIHQLDRNTLEIKEQAEVDIKHDQLIDVNKQNIFKNYNEIKSQEEKDREHDQKIEILTDKINSLCKQRNVLLFISVANFCLFVMFIILTVKFIDM